MGKSGTLTGGEEWPLVIGADRRGIGGEVGLFGKKQQPLDDMPLEDDWSVATGRIDGFEVLARSNTSLKRYMGHREMPVRLGIAVPLNAPDERGFPGEDELAPLAYIENVLFEQVNAARVGRVVWIVTMNGMREFVSYVRSAAHAEAIIKQLRSTIASHEVQSYHADDPDWGFAREIA